MSLDLGIWDIKEMKSFPIISSPGGAGGEDKHWLWCGRCFIISVSPKMRSSHFLNLVFWSPCPLTFLFHHPCASSAHCVHVSVLLLAQYQVTLLNCPFNISTSVIIGIEYTMFISKPISLFTNQKYIKTSYCVSRV